MIKDDKQAAAAVPGSKPYRLPDFGGLYLDVRPSGQKFWRYRFRLDGKENLHTIGRFPAVGILAARMKRDQARLLVEAGKDPNREKEAEKVRVRLENRQTFEAVLDEWLETRDWGAATRRNRVGQIDLHIRPHLGPLPVSQITPMMVLDVLQRAEKGGNASKSKGQGARTRQTGGALVARRLRQYISGVFDLAIITMRADSNPAGSLRGALTKAKKTTHKTPLTPVQVAAVLRAINAYQGTFHTPMAFRLLWWTLARPVEISGAEWSEFDLDGSLWTIPAERMKGQQKHRIPLPLQAVEMLRGLHAISGGMGYLFPHRDHADRPMPRDTLTAAAPRMKLGFEYSPHATRTTGSTILNELGYRFDVIEAQLAHQDSNAVRRAYNRTDYLEERREMIQAWANMLDSWRAGATVLPMRKSETSKTAA